MKFKVGDKIIHKNCKGYITSVDTSETIWKGIRYDLSYENNPTSIVYLGAPECDIRFDREEKLKRILR